VVDELPPVQLARGDDHHTVEKHFVKKEKMRQES